MIQTMIPGMTVATPSSPAVTAPSTAATAEAPTDFAALVDSIARARTDSGDAAASAVGVTLSHGDFGRVSLQFTPREEGLSVTMRSADPGFAPAAAAAAATGGNSDPGNHHTGQQAQPSPSQQSPAQNNGSGSGQAPQGDTARQNARQRLARNPSPGAASDAADDSDIFA
jgi:hypothetical protein